MPDRDPREAHPGRRAHDLDGFVEDRGRMTVRRTPEWREVKADLHHLPLSFKSSYGPENGKPVMSPRPDSSTRGPKPPIAASCQIGANIALSWTSCWIRCSVASRRFRLGSAACSRNSPSMSG